MTELDVAVRDAVQRMRIPEHQPDFWDHLAAQLDRVEGRRISDRNRRAAQAAQHRAEERGRELSAANPRLPKPGPVDEPAPAPYEPREFAPDPRHVVVTDDGAMAPVLEGRFGAGAGARAGGRDRGRRPGERTERRHGTRHVRIERDLNVVPHAMRQQRSNLAVAALAVAAVAVVLLAGNSLVRSRSGGGAADTALEAENTAFRADSLAASSNDPAVQAVLAWVGQLGNGDADGAWAALGPASQQAVGGREEFDARFSSLSEGYGLWAGTQPDALLITPVTAGADGTVSIVTLIGEAGGDLRADAVPVRITAGVATIEAFADAGSVGLESPDSSQGAEVDVDDELSVLVPSRVTPLIRLDQGPVQRCGEALGTTLESVDGGKQRCRYLPQGGMQAGGRVLTVAFVGSDGEGVSARSVRFQAA
jgi:hypothetical protein